MSGREPQAPTVLTADAVIREKLRDGTWEWIDSPTADLLALRALLHRVRLIDLLWTEPQAQNGLEP
jgi:hypothetical protein